MKRLLQPALDYTLATRLFLKCLALIYLAAFLSLAVQIDGLVGPSGILPFGERLDAATDQLGRQAWLYFPTLFWFDQSDAALQTGAILGCLLSLLLLFDIKPRLSLALLFILYLSLVRAGQLFLNFQWDYLLLESGFLAIFLVNGPNRLVILLYHWLLFRLRFMSGVGKLASGDPSWSGLTALQSYFETQPLPHTGAWLAHQLPDWLLQTGVVLVLFSELLVPFFIFLPRRFRILAAVITVFMQLLIIATSNHNFVNLLTIALCLFLLDDRLLRRLIPGRLFPANRNADNDSSRTLRWLTLSAALLIFSSSVPLLLSMSLSLQFPDSVNRWTQIVRRYGIGNAYHVFPTMQTERIELQIEGSNDGEEWKSYVLPWQPGPLSRRPAFIVPHQPRLDWMIWFVPTQQPINLYWFERFLQRLAEGSPAVTKLLESNPFQAEPPAYLRVSAYRYRFSNWQERAATGDWWQREYLGPFPYVPPRRP